MSRNPTPQLKLAVCDDEPTDLQQGEMMASEILTAESLPCKISGYESATALLTDIQGGAQFHILSLDMMMEGLDGMDLQKGGEADVPDRRM